jgi:hypothetical protein
MVRTFHIIPAAIPMPIAKVRPSILNSMVRNHLQKLRAPDHRLGPEIPDNIVGTLLIC